jgi:hypothetical protein
VLPRGRWCWQAGQRLQGGAGLGQGSGESSLLATGMRQQRLGRIRQSHGISSDPGKDPAGGITQRGERGREIGQGASGSVGLVMGGGWPI